MVYDVAEEGIPDRCANLVYDDGDGEGKGMIVDNGWHDFESRRKGGGKGLGADDGVIVVMVQWREGEGKMTMQASILTIHL